MILKTLKLNNFRNLQKLDLSFDKRLHYIYSPNGTGKTNLLEAIQLLSVGKSLRAESETDLFNFKSKNSRIKVEGEFEDEDEIKFKQSVEIKRNDGKKKVLLHNKNKVSINEYIGRTPSIWFSPENIKIISTSPLNKRKYFDDIMMQLSPEYGFNLRAYNRSLKQRNKVLQSEEIDRNSIKVWTENLINYGCKVIEYKRSFFEMLNQGFTDLKDFPRYEFYIEHLPNVNLSTIFDEDCAYRFRSELQSSYQKDILNQSTGIGPHKDDWDLRIKIKPQKEFISCEKFASRGQQRMSLIVLQIVLINLFIKNKNIIPIMLLDDIFSELDKENEKILLSFIKEKGIQTFITGVGKIKSPGLKQIELIELMEI